MTDTNNAWSEVVTASNSSALSDYPVDVQVRHHLLFLEGILRGLVNVPSSIMGGVCDIACVPGFCQAIQAYLSVLRLNPSLRYFSELPEQERQTHPFSCSPYIACFVSIFEDFCQQTNFEWHLYYFMQWLNGHCLSGECAESWADALNGCIVRFYHHWHSSSGYMVQEAGIVRRINKGRLSCIQYLGHLFDTCSRLLVVELVLNSQTSQSGFISLEQSQDDLNRFLYAVDHHALLGQRIGYMTIREYGIQRGYHFNALFFFNGHKHREDGSIAALFRKIWQQVTQGRGSAFSGNFDKASYEIPVTGMVHRTDTIKREKLNQLIHYFIKRESNMHLFGKAGMRDLRRGMLPR